MFGGMDKRTLPTSLLLLMLLVAAATADVLQITGPDLAGQGQYVTLAISGLSAQELSRANVAVSPAASTVVIPATTWGGQPILLFSAATDGSYEISVTLNQFVRAFSDAKAQAEAAGVDEETLAAYRSLHTRLVTDYPSAAASHTVTVGQPGPDPDPDPVPPPDKVQLLIVEETGQRRPPYGDVFIQLRRSDTLQNVELFIVDQDGKTPEGRQLPNIQSYIDQITSPLPVLFVIGEGTDGRGRILHQGTCPPSLVGVLEVVGKFRRLPQ